MKKLTKKARIEQVRALIDKNELFIPFPPTDLRSFLHLVNPADDIEGVKREINAKFPTDTRHLHMLISGEWQPKSWHKMITPVNGVAERLRTMRGAVRDDLRDFRESAQPQEYWGCGATSDLTTDHVAPLFDTIARCFLDHAGMFAIEKCSTGIGYVFADIDTEASWVSFHARHACYQLMCRSCNASKGKR